MIAPAKNELAPTEQLQSTDALRQCTSHQESRVPMMREWVVGSQGQDVSLMGHECLIKTVGGGVDDKEESEPAFLESWNVQR